jgi:hypothetical protein
MRNTLTHCSKVSINLVNCFMSLYNTQGRLTAALRSWD